MSKKQIPHKTLARIARLLSDLRKVSDLLVTVAYEKKAPKIHLSAPNLQNAAQMSRVLFKRSEKGQEKSNFPKKVMARVLTKAPKRGIFITLISTRTD